MKIVTVVGARPQFIKAAVLSRAIDEFNRSRDSHRVEEIIVHTGQHYDRNMSEVFFEQMNIRFPTYNLDVGGASHGKGTGLMLERVETVLLEEKPNWVLVYGDTNSTLAGALAAAKLHIPVAHVEAGLRSFNRRMAEEVNRIATDHVSELLFCPTETAFENLVAEGLKSRSVVVGDVMYDGSLYYRRLASKKSSILSELGIDEQGYVLATCHRAENTDDAHRLREIVSGLAQIASRQRVVLPLHPRTRAAIQRNAITDLLGDIDVIEPVSFLDMIRLEESAATIITDSGGVQKEAYFFQVPCITMRDETEWVETVEAGWNCLVGADSKKISAAESSVVRPKEWPAYYGDGHAGTAILRHLLEASGS
jgi:UDP-GlcNAc3NAcA epimerase